VRQGGGRDHQINRSRSAGLAASGYDTSTNSTIGPSASRIERNQFESRLGLLDSLEPPSPDQVVRGRYRPTGELCQGQRRDSHASWKPCDFDRLKGDNYGSVS
jgi:hypothetical protein